MIDFSGQSSDTKANDRVHELLNMMGTLAKTGVLPNHFNLDHGY